MNRRMNAKILMKLKMKKLFTLYMDHYFLRKNVFLD